MALSFVRIKAGGCRFTLTWAEFYKQVLKHPHGLPAIEVVEVRR